MDDGGALLEVAGITAWRSQKAVEGRRGRGARARMMSAAPSPQVIALGLNVGEWDRLRSPFPLACNKCARTHAITARGRATDPGTPQIICVRGPRARGGGPQHVVQSRHVRGPSGPSDFQAAGGTRAKPEGLPQDSTDASFPATTGMPRSGFRGNWHTVGVAGPGARRFRLAQGGNCEGPLIRRRRTFTASGTTIGGMNPGQATEPRSFSKTAGPTSP